MFMQNAGFFSLSVLSFAWLIRSRAEDIAERKEERIGKQHFHQRSTMPDLMKREGDRESVRVATPLQFVRSVAKGGWDKGADG